jgi:hypothetical protein
MRTASSCKNIFGCPYILSKSFGLDPRAGLDENKSEQPSFIQHHPLVSNKIIPRGFNQRVLFFFGGKRRFPGWFVISFPLTENLNIINGMTTKRVMEKSGLTILLSRSMF